MTVREIGIALYVFSLGKTEKKNGLTFIQFQHFLPVFQSGLSLPCRIHMRIFFVTKSNPAWPKNE